MSVRSGVEQNAWTQVDYAASVSSLRVQFLRARRLLPHVTVVLLAALAILFAISCSGPSVAFRSDSRVSTLSVEVADTPGERVRGLMGRESLAADSGMLFDFGKDVRESFWMKNTSIPLSIAFVDGKGRVLAIKDMEPFDETPVEPPGEYRYAIEANRGWFDSHGVRPGSTALIDL